MIWDEINITVVDDRLLVQSPFHPDFVERAKQLNGKWDSLLRQWIFDPRDEEGIREVCRKIYGTDGVPVPVVDVELILDELEEYKHRPADNQFYFAGRMVVTRRGRDYLVKLGDGVVIIAGGFPKSGGSMKWPNLSPKKGTVLEVRDVAEGLINESMPGIRIVRRNGKGADNS